MSQLQLYGPNSNCMHPCWDPRLGAPTTTVKCARVCETPGRFTTNSRVGGQQEQHCRAWRSRLRALPALTSVLWRDVTLSPLPAEFTTTVVTAFPIPSVDRVHWGCLRRHDGIHCNARLILPPVYLDEDRQLLLALCGCSVPWFHGCKRGESLEALLLPWHGLVHRVKHEFNQRCCI